jgi:hypothetical protein
LAESSRELLDSLDAAGCRSEHIRWDVIDQVIRCVSV